MMINYPHFDIGDIKFKPITFSILSFPQQQPAYPNYGPADVSADLSCGWL